MATVAESAARDEGEIWKAMADGKEYSADFNTLRQWIAEEHLIRDRLRRASAATVFPPLFAARPSILDP
jgi:hypothetical protein